MNFAIGHGFLIDLQRAGIVCVSYGIDREEKRQNECDTKNADFFIEGYPPSPHVNKGKNIIRIPQNVNNMIFIESP